MSVIVTIKKNDTLPNAIALLLSDSEYIETSYKELQTMRQKETSAPVTYGLECKL